MNDTEEIGVETLSIAEIRAMGLKLVGLPECEESHLDDLSRDTLAPRELVSVFSADVLDDLNNRARAISYGWHKGEKLEQDILAVANALPKLTAALRRSPCT